MMKANKKAKWMALGMSLALIGVMVSGCSTNQNTDQTPGGQSDHKLSGFITMAGSTSMEKMANALSEGFMKKNTSVTVSTEFVGSSAGVESLLSGKCQIGNASRTLKDSEKTSGAVENIVAIDGIAVIVNNQDALKNLTKQQLIDIYTGKVKYWGEVGGKGAIVVVGREAGSGTRDAFEELLEVKDSCVYANELDSTGAVLAKVASTPGAIGYVSLDVLNETVTAISLDGISPTEENIKERKYFLSRPFVMATKGELSTQSELIKAWFEYIESPQGQDILKKVGLISATK